MTGVEVRSETGVSQVEADEVISTLALDDLVAAFDPPPPGRWSRPPGGCATATF